MPTKTKKTQKRELTFTQPMLKEDFLTITVGREKEAIEGEQEIEYLLRYDSVISGQAK